MTHWITTASGHTFDAANPTPDDIRLDDIAHALGNLCRFTGHTSRFYSVLEHSMLCLAVHRAAAPGPTPERRLAVLLHDAHEAYINDVSTPVKHLIGEKYAELRDKYDAAIAEAFGLAGPHVFHAAYVTFADALALQIEAWYLLPDQGVTGGINSPSPWGLADGGWPAPPVSHAPNLDDLRWRFKVLVGMNQQQEGTHR